MTEHIRTSLVTNALEAAQRSGHLPQGWSSTTPTGVAQYTSTEFDCQCRKWNI